MHSHGGTMEKRLAGGIVGEPQAREVRETGRIVVAMSGGVDSSTAAAILAREGRDVTGIGLKLASSGDGKCCGASDLDGARTVCAKLGIPFYAINASVMFEQAVVSPFCDAYASGLTPNPCCVCNVEIKFGYLLRLALAAGFDEVASGHYARIERDLPSGRLVLRRGTDERQDQSYFLYGLSQWQLERVVFPLGTMSKPQVRRLAKELGLPVHDKPQSQDTCFFRSGGLRPFIESRMPSRVRPGPVLDTEGRIVGRHRGSLHLTVGQRKGVGVALGRPVYVKRVVPRQNAVVVAPREEMFVTRVRVEGINWLVWESPSKRFPARVQIRYGHVPAQAMVHTDGDGNAVIEFEKPQFAPAPGQVAAMYDGDRLLGGGTVVPDESPMPVPTPPPQLPLRSAICHRPCGPSTRTAPRTATGAG